MVVDDLKEFANNNGIILRNQNDIVEEAIQRIKQRYNYNVDDIKRNFDSLLDECEKEAYRVYLKSEADYGGKIFSRFVQHISHQQNVSDPVGIGRLLGEHFKVIDRFFLSLAQARKSRAGKSFEHIHNSLFKELSYPFTEQAVINGKPDFIMPSVEHYRVNPLECVIFSVKRTLRERWRQIVTEGNRGIGFYLATIDDNVSENQLHEMMRHRIFLVVPKSLKEEKYPDAENVLSFSTFFEEHLDPKVKIWKRKKII
jgi:hypothetical protein